MNLEDSLKSASSENSSTHPDLQHLIARRMRAELHERLLRDAIVAFQKTDDERR
jgi:hypothetical protein